MTSSPRNGSQPYIWTLQACSWDYALTHMLYCIGVLGLLLFIPCFELGSGLYGDYPPMNEAGLQMLHDMYLDTGNTTGFWEALQAYQGSSSYRLASSSTDLVCYLSFPGACDQLCWLANALWSFSSSSLEIQQQHHRPFCAALHAYYNPSSYCLQL